MNALQTAVARIDRASLRERALLFVAAVGLLALVWNQLLMVPLATRRTSLAQSLDEAQQRLSITGADADTVAEQYASQKSREAALATAIAATDAQLRDARAGMIDPKQMVTVLTDVLSHQKGLTVLLLRNLEVEQLLRPVGESAAGAAPLLGPYLHPVELVLRGEYLDVLAYLQELEAQPWGFQWRRFDYATTADGPEYRIQFTTLSMESNWLGL